MRSRFLLDVFLAVVALSISFFLYSILDNLVWYGIYVVNLFSVIVVVLAIKEGAVFGAFLGTACGLIQDAFSGGIFGISGLTKTILGYSVGRISRFIDISTGYRKVVFIFLLSSGELVLWIVLSAFIRGQKVFLADGIVVLQPAVTSVISSVILALEHRLSLRRS